MGVLDRAVNIATNAGARLVAPPSDVSTGLAEKGRMIDEYTRSTQPVRPVESHPGIAPTRPTGKRYGDRPGEKRIDVRSMQRPLGSYKEGTPSVPKTGVYKLHKGEAVVPAEKNPYAKVVEADEKPKKVLHEIRTRKAKSGGFIHEHHYTEPGHHKMEEHTTPDMESMVAHYKKHMGPEDVEKEAKAEGESTAVEAQEQALGM